VYYAPIRVWNVKEECEETVEVPVLLPHEIVGRLLEEALFLKAKNIIIRKLFCYAEGVTTAEALRRCDKMDESTRRHIDAASASLGERVVGLGLWIDGAPCNWDRSETLEIFSLNFPNVPKLRIPLVGINNRFVAKELGGEGGRGSRGIGGEGAGAFGMWDMFSACRRPP